MQKMGNKTYKWCYSTGHDVMYWHPSAIVYCITTTQGGQVDMNL